MAYDGVFDTQTDVRVPTIRRLSLGSRLAARSQVNTLLGHGRPPSPLLELTSTAAGTSQTAPPGLPTQALGTVRRPLAHKFKDVGGFSREPCCLCMG